MALKKETVLDRQSIWDIAAQHYGAMEGIIQLMNDNPSVFNLESSPVPGTIFFVQDKPLNKKVVEFFADRVTKPCGAVEIPYTSPIWIMDDGSYDDLKFWLDNGVWID